MQPAEAIAIAKDYVAALYAQEEIKHLGLEELRFDAREGIWNVTVGFYRLWDQVAVKGLERYRSPDEQRTYKLIRVRDRDGVVLEMLNRPLAA